MVYTSSITSSITSSDPEYTRMIPLEAPHSEDETQSQAAYRLIEAMIVTNELTPKSKISETSLSKKLGIGRTPIREALKRLSFEGAVSIISRSGAFVSDIDLLEQLAMIEVRKGIEQVLAGRAARFAGDKERIRFRELAQWFDEVAKSANGRAFVDADREFNALVVATARNKYAAQAIAPIEAQTRRFWYVYFKNFGDLPRVSRLHARLARRIAENNEAAARKCSDEIVDYAEEYTRKTLRFFDAK